MERAARAGLTAKGVLYLLLGVVTAQLGLGLPDTVVSRQGAFATLAGQPFGAGLLLLLALGLGSYALWRAWQVVVGVEGRSSLPEPLLRVTFAVRALVYGVLAALAAREAVGAIEGGVTESLTAELLALPGGVALVVLVGCALFVTGLAQWRKVVTRDFLDQLDVEAMSELERRCVRALGLVGHAARGAALGLVGFFLAYSAWTRTGLVGLDAALHEVARTTFGNAAVLVVAAGFTLYGLFCFVQTHTARVRSID